MDKFIMKSKTIWGGIIMLLPVLDVWFGTNWIADLAGPLQDFAKGLVALVGFGGVIYGRLNANLPLRALPFDVFKEKGGN